MYVYVQIISTYVCMNNSREMQAFISIRHTSMHLRHLLTKNVSTAAATTNNNSNSSNNDDNSSNDSNSNSNSNDTRINTTEAFSSIRRASMHTQRKEKHPNACICM